MLVIAHRGASVARAENTPAAFETADRMGADGVELDVRLARAADGSTELLVHHDPLPTDPESLAGLPGLDEVLDACGARMLVNVEIKNHVDDGGHDPAMAVVEPTIAALRRRGVGWSDRVLISSFDLATIDRCRAVAPEFPTAFLTTVVGDRELDLAVAGGHAAVHPHHAQVDADVVGRAHERGLIVNVWTANDPDRLRTLADLGVDGACTDVPDVALDALGRGAAGSPARVRPTWPRRRPTPPAR